MATPTPIPVQPTTAPVAAATPEQTRMQQSVGQGTVGPQITAQSPEVVKFMQANPGVSVDAAIGSVVGQQTQQPAQTTPTQQQPVVSTQAPTAPVQPPTQQSTTQPTTPATDPNDRILAALNAGGADVNDIATRSGLTPQQVQQTMSADPNMAYLMQSNAQFNTAHTALMAADQKLNQIQNGQFELTPTQQNQMNAVRQMFEELKQQQLVANKNFEGAVTNNEIRAGRQEFANNIASGNFKQAVDDGIHKIQKLDQEMVKQMAELTTSFQEQNFKIARDQYDRLKDLEDEKAAQIDKIHDETAKMIEASYKQQKQEAELIKVQENAAKLQQEASVKLATEIAPSIIDSLSGNAELDNELITQIAINLGIDPLLLRGNVAEYQDKQNAPQVKADIAAKAAQEKAALAAQTSGVKFEEDLLKKGFRTINPKDVQRMRAAGNDVVEYKGRAYMKEVPLKMITIGSGKSARKVMVDAKGNIVKQVSGGTTSTPGKATPKPSKPGTTGGTEKQAVSEMTRVMGSVTGDDGYISPDDYKALRKQWAAAGLSTTVFDTKFKGYRNPNNANYVTNKQ